MADNYIQTINSSISTQNVVISELDNKNKQLLEKQEVQINQLKEIEDKEKLLLTRSRMLQIAQDRNSYKKKIIYTLIATIFLIFILTIALYVFFVRKKASIPVNNKV
jgi:hypothetical protein